ncbi:MAG: hypothetical protein RIC89_05815, partial [Pseudomonadales bacterium]
MSNVKIAQRANIAGIHARHLGQELAPVSKEKLDFVANYGDSFRICYVVAHPGHFYFNALIQRRKFTSMLFNPHQCETDFGKCLAPVAYLGAILGDLRQVASFLNKKTANDLGHSADLELLPGPGQALL